MKDTEKILRILDANLNRAREGLRVCEDIARFIYNDRFLTGRFKTIRHQCSKIILTLPKLYRSVLLARDTGLDVGKRSVIKDKPAAGWSDLFSSNVKRAEESLRVLEEVSKIVMPKKSREFQHLRFEVYGFYKTK